MIVYLMLIRDYIFLVEQTLILETLHQSIQKVNLMDPHSRKAAYRKTILIIGSRLKEYNNNNFSLFKHSFFCFVLFAYKLSCVFYQIKK